MKKLYAASGFLLTGLMVFIFMPTEPWLTDFGKAQEEARKNNKLILLYFSGSDWCSVCGKFKKEILETSVFSDYASEHLVLVNADFPRMKKNQLDKMQTSQNESLAERYNKVGIFPKTLLLDAEGKTIKEWEGYENYKAEGFVNQLKKYNDKSGKSIN